MTRGRNEQSGAEAERKLRGRAEAKLIRGNAGRQTGEAKSRRKSASDESTVLEVFLHCIALKVCQTMAKLQAFCPVKGTEGARTLKTAQEREQANTQICRP